MNTLHHKQTNIYEYRARSVHCSHFIWLYMYVCVCVYGIPHISIFVFMGSLETVFFFFVSDKENKVFTMPAIVRVLSMLKDYKRFQ